jgi:hypothetical protein
MEQIKPELVSQKITLDSNALRIQLPMTMTVVGASMAGKSEFVLNLVKFRNALFTSEFHRIVYCQPDEMYSQNQSYFLRLQNEFSKVELCSGIPNLSKLNLECNTLPCLLILDDLMFSIMHSQTMFDLITRYVHHNNVSVIMTLQNYFLPSSNKYGKSLIRNALYRVFFYNRIDKREMSIISSQISNSSHFFDANFNFLLNKFPNEPSYYLLIDGQFRSKMKNMWCRSLIFPNENGEIEPIIFYPNPKYSKK